MTNAAEVGEAAEGGAARERGQLVVDPALLREIKSGSAPAGVPKWVRPAKTMPGSLSVIGSVRAIVENIRRGILHGVDQRARYGDVYQVSFGGMPMVMVWDPNEIQRILKNDDRVWSTAMGWDAIMFQKLDPGSKNLGTLLSFDFDDHAAARRLVQPAFTLKAIEGYLAIADRTFSATIPSFVSRRQIDFKHEVRTLLARVAGEIFTGIREPKRVAEVDRALSDFWRGMLAVARHPWLSPRFRKSRKGLQTLLRIFRELARERRTSGGDDLFSQMCADSKSPEDDEARVRVFISIMFGAFDTTSAAITSMAYLLAKHPGWQERVRSEVLPLDERLDVASMRKLKHLEWVWKETLRLFPVNGVVPRRALRDVEIGGHLVRAGTLVGAMNGGIGRHPGWWTKPDTFDPERFSPERAEDRRHPGIYNPFGGGAHACVGMQLANMEMKVFWHRMLRACRFRLTKPYEAHHTFTPMGMASGKVTLTLEPR